MNFVQQFYNLLLSAGRKLGLGDMLYAKNSVEVGVIDPNTTTTQKFLSMTGDGSNGAAPTWEEVTVSGGNAIYGDGSDGALDFDGSSTVAGIAPTSGNYNLTKNIVATSINIANGVTVDPKGFMIYCTGTTTFNGTGRIAADGGDGAAGGTAGSSPTTGQVWGGATRPAAGAGTTGNGVGASPASADPTAGGGSGAGGNGTGGRTGGAGQSANMTHPSTLHSLPVALSGVYFTGAVTKYINPNGCGGGGGAGDGTNSGGGGGGPGGFVFVASKNFAASGTSGTQMSADGGNGGSPGTGNCGGGAAGGGGLVIIITSEALPSGVSASAVAGTKGLKVGTGTDGAAASDGRVITIIN